MDEPVRARRVKLVKEIARHVALKLDDLTRQIAEAEKRRAALELAKRDRASLSPDERRLLDAGSLFDRKLNCRGLFDPDQSPLTEQGEEDGVVRMPDGTFRFGPLKM